MDRVIYPPIVEHSILRQKLTAGEMAVLRVFDRCLPLGWEIYIQPHVNGLRPDFVLLNPNVGIAVFEVKDWDLDAMRYFIAKDELGYDALWAERDGVAFSKQHDNPITKVNLYKREIFDLYCPRVGVALSSRGRDGWAAITAAVIFPFAKTGRVKTLLRPFMTDGDAGDYARYQPISGSEEIESFDINSIFPESTREGSRLMSADIANDLRGWLVEPDFSSVQRQPLELDRRQRALVDSRTESGYRRIKGPAGSGKSLVLAARAGKLLNEGKTVLVITYNITLWHYLRDLIVRAIDTPGNLKNLCLSHFHLWCKHVCYEVGWGEAYDAIISSASDRKRGFRGGPSLDRILNEEIPALASRAVEMSNARKYDAILVDEGQDYRPEWWNILRKAHIPRGEMMLVADATQDVYGTAKAWTDDVMQGAGFRGGWAQLDVSYRLPRSALEMAREFARRFLPQDSAVLPEIDQGSLDLHPSVLRWVQCRPDQAVRVCADEVRALMHETGVNGLANADITVLCAETRFGKELAEHLIDAYRIKTVNTFDEDAIEQRRQKMAFYMGDARIKATTLHSFKGWESRLLVVHVSKATDPKSLALVYAGLTRLKRHVDGSWLTVVCSADELNAFGATWPSYRCDDVDFDFF